LCIPTTTLALPISARICVAIEVSGHRSPNHAYGVRPRRDHRVSRVQTDSGPPVNICASQPRRLPCPFVHVPEWPKKYLAIEVQTTPTVCVHDATTGCGGCRPTAGLPSTFVHPNHAACPAHSCTYRSGHRSIWPYKSKPRLRCASTTRPPGVEGANRRRGSPQHLCIPTTTLAHPIRARIWVAIEVFGHRSPNHAYGVRPRRDHRVSRVQTDGGPPVNICASQPRRLPCPFVHVPEWP